MADKISDLPVAGAAFLVDEDECNQSGVSRKVSNTQRMALFKANQYDQDLDSTDAVTFLTVNTGQGNNLLYPMDQNLTTGNNVRFATVDTGQGNNELFGMNQNVRSTDSPTFLSINTGQGANELYAMDQDVKTTDPVIFSGITAATVNTGQGANKLYDMDQNVRTIDSPVFSSINTGQGVTEVHLMNQNIRIADSVTFGTVYIGGGSIDASSVMQADSTTKGFLPPRMTTVQKDAISSPATGLIVYDTDTNQWEGYNGTAWFTLNLDDDLIVHSTTWGGAFSTPISGGDISIYKVGRMVIAHFSDISGTADTATTINATTNLPNTLFPENLLGEQIRPIEIIDNGTNKTGYITIAATNGAITVSAGISGTSFAGAGSTGFQDFYISWIANIPGGP